MFLPNRNVVTREWRKLPSYINGLYSSQNIIRPIKSRIMRWARHVARMGGEEQCVQDLVSRSEGMKSLGRSRHRCKNNIKMLL